MLFRFDFNNYNLPSTDFIQSKLNTSFHVLNFDCLGGYREGETPGPIPNPEAKPLFADNTLPFRNGNVGRCLVDQFILIPFILFLYYFYLLLFFITYIYIFDYKNYIKFYKKYTIL